MSVNYIPNEIADYLKGIDLESVFGVKAFCDLYGKTGEGYVFIAGNQLYLFSKAYASEMIHIATEVNDNVALKVRDEQFSLFLDIQIDDQELSCRFSSLDRDDLNQLCALCESLKTGSSEDAENKSADAPVETTTAPESDDIASSDFDMTIKDAFAAALLFAGCSDGELSDQEQSFIRSICSEESVTMGVEFYENNSFDTLLELLKGISYEQKLCFLANMIELTMLDGVIHRTESGIFNSFSYEMGIDAETHSAIYDVLLAKNNFSVFHA